MSRLSSAAQLPTGAGRARWWGRCTQESAARGAGAGTTSPWRAGGRARGYACECVRVCRRRPCGGDAACGSRLPLQRVLAAQAAGAVVLRAQQVRRAGLPIATAASCRRTRRGCGRPGRGFRTSRLCGSLSLSFFARSACLLRATWVVFLRVGRAPAAGGWGGRRWAGARGCWGSPRGRAPAGVAAREGRGRRWLGWRGGVSRLPRSPALSSSSSGSLHPLQAPSGAGTSIPPPSGMRSALFSAALQRGFPRLRPPHSFMFFLLATVFTLFDRVLFLHLVVYISFPKEWLLTPPCRYGAVVFDNNHFSTSDLNVGWTARDRGWRLQNRVAQSCYRLGICIFYIYAWEADGGHVISLQSEFTL